MSIRRIAVLIAIIPALLAPLVAGCRPGLGQPQVALAMSDAPRETAPAVAEGALPELVAGNNAFACDLYQAVRAEDGNLFFSPYSISQALAMAYAGARGDTERQMAETLHYTLPQAELHPAFNALDQELVPAGEKEAGFELRIANSAWGQKGFPFQSAYLDTIAKSYGAGVRLVDYTADGPREEARQAINDWVDGETKGKIKDLLAPDALSQDTRLVLANAIYFQGDWEEPFSSNTTDAAFTLPSGEEITVPMMSRRGLIRHAEGDGWQAAKLPYRGDRAQMIVLLPDEGRFDSLESSLDPALLEAILGALEEKDLKIYLPRFSFAADLNLEGTLAEMGMSDAFDPGRADLTGMYDRAQSNNLYLSRVIHKGFVAVDEEGTEAAAATGIVAEIVSMSREMRLDRPFIFLIRDGETGALLFLGRVLDPR